MTAIAEKKTATPASNSGVAARPPTLTQGPHWGSFEKFRVQGQEALKEVRSGVVGTLSTRTGQFRVLSEEDFQRLYGLARDVERIQGGLRVVIAAARTAHQHRDDSSLETLMEAVALLAQSPALPVRSQLGELQPEGLPLQEEDEDVELDPARVPRPYPSRGAE